MVPRYLDMKPPPSSFFALEKCTFFPSGVTFSMSVQIAYSEIVYQQRYLVATCQHLYWIISVLL